MRDDVLVFAAWLGGGGDVLRKWYGRAVLTSAHLVDGGTQALFWVPVQRNKTKRNRLVLCSRNTSWAAQAHRKENKHVTTVEPLSPGIIPHDVSGIVVVAIDCDSMDVETCHEFYEDCVVDYDKNDNMFCRDITCYEQHSGCTEENGCYKSDETHMCYPIGEDPPCEHYFDEETCPEDRCSYLSELYICYETGTLEDIPCSSAAHEEGCDVLPHCQFHLAWSEDWGVCLAEGATLPCYLFEPVETQCPEGCYIHSDPSFPEFDACLPIRTTSSFHGTTDTTTISPRLTSAHEEEASGDFTTTTMPPRTTPDSETEASGDFSTTTMPPRTTPDSETEASGDFSTTPAPPHPSESSSTLNLSPINTVYPSSTSTSTLNLSPINTVYPSSSSTLIILHLLRRSTSPRSTRSTVHPDHTFETIGSSDPWATTQASFGASQSGSLSTLAVGVIAAAVVIAGAIVAIAIVKVKAKKNVRVHHDLNSILVDDHIAWSKGFPMSSKRVSHSGIVIPVAPAEDVDV
eukprot:gene748-4040_t